jgi:hypothetical protein
MGTDINGAFGHRIPFPPSESLAHTMRAGIHPTGPMFQSDWWFDPNNTASSRLIHIHGHGLSVYFGPHAAIISSGYGWLEDRDEQRAAVAAIRAVARFFRSPSVIFLPDDIEPWCYADQWIADGPTFDDLQRRLAAIKEPSSDFRAAIRQMPDCYEVDGYVMEELDYDAV